MNTIAEVIKYVDETYPELSNKGKSSVCMQIWGKMYGNGKIDQIKTLMPDFEYVWKKDMDSLKDKV